MRKNTIRELIDTLRPTLPTVAKWTRVSVWTAQNWRQGLYKPTATKRAALVKATRAHAKGLLNLAAKVEREGKAQQGGK